MGSTMAGACPVHRSSTRARLIVTFGSGSGPGARRGSPAPPGTHPSDRSAQGGKPDDHALDTPRNAADVGGPLGRDRGVLEERRLMG